MGRGYLSGSPENFIVRDGERSYQATFKQRVSMGDGFCGQRLKNFGQFPANGYLSMRLIIILFDRFTANAGLTPSKPSKQALGYVK